VCEKIRLYRTADKMINTYIVPITNMAMADEHDRVHPTFWVVSSTGRTRSEKPNFQNIPAWLGEEFSHLSIRKNFLAAPGRKLLVSDLSQIELRMVGHISGDPLFLDAYCRWKCTACEREGTSTTILHSCPECGCAENAGILEDSRLQGFWHGQDLHQQTSDRVSALRGSRQDGKRSNFALVYYATASMMNYHYPNLSVAQWQEVIDEYFGPRAYLGVAKWHDRMRVQLEAHGETTDVFGRRRRITRDNVRRNYKHALNQLINFGPQASACELIELSLVKMREQFIERNAWLRTVFPVNFVHDEIVLEVVEDYIAEALPVVRDCMELSVKFKVPIRADALVVDRWGDAK
jgi:DNA polymerase-1